MLYHIQKLTQTVIDLNVKSRTIKFLKEIFCNFGTGKYFLGTTPKA